MKFDTRFPMKHFYPLWISLLPLFLGSCSSDRPPLEKTFRLAWESTPRTLDPRYAVDADSQYLVDLIHCALLGFDLDGKIKGGIRLRSKMGK